TGGGLGINNTTDEISATNGGGLTCGGGLAVAKTAYVGTGVITPSSYKSNIIFNLSSGTASATYKIANMSAGGSPYAIKFYINFSGGKHSMTEIDVVGTYQENVCPPAIDIKKSS